MGGFRITSALFASAVLAAAGFAAMPATAGPRAVIELFTSQGCSSCPLADKLLGELARDSSIVALSLPIDYWDYLGWKDTLALPSHAKRQRAYANVRGDRQVYTPQVVVNGVAHVLGSDKAAIERAVEQTRKNADVLVLPLTLIVADGQVTVKVPAVATAKKAEIWLCPIIKSIEVAIGRGENNGRTVTYHNVVRRWVKIGDWSGNAGSWSVPLKEIVGDDIQAVAAVAQANSAAAPGVMLGAAIADLP